MKVCTDSCILGAYVHVQEAKSALDIGTGTGLLALMIAQRSAAYIEAVEIDPAAAWQAAENVAVSPWADRIRVYPQPLQEFAATNRRTYDLILSNPPFFQASLRSPVAGRTLARHTTDLRWEHILDFAGRFLRPKGCLWVMLPPAESNLLVKCAEGRDWFITHRLVILTHENGKCIRWIQAFRREPQAFTEQQLAIRTPDGTYTREFSNLLQEYYLYL